MEEKKEAPETKPSEDNADKSEINIEFMGQQFNVATTDGQAGYNAARAVFEKTFGKQSQEVGSLRKQIEPMTRLNARADTPDEATFVKKVGKLLDEGQAEDAVREMFGYVGSIKQEFNDKEQETKWWSKYWASRKDQFKGLDEEMAKTYVFSNYRDVLYSADDPASHIDAVLTPKVSQVNPVVSQSVEDNSPMNVAGSGNAPSDTSSQPKIDQKEDEGSGTWDSMLDEFGFK